MPLSKYYARSVPSAGELPYLEFGLGHTLIYMTSDKSGRFEICTDLVPDITRQQQHDDGIFKQPDWAFHVSNGRDQLYLHRNAGICKLRFRNPESETDIETLMTEIQAIAVADSLGKVLDDCTPLQRHKRRLKPLGTFYTYKVRSVVIDPRSHL